MCLNFIEVNPSNINHIRYLFIILRKRKYNISNDKLTKYKDHKNFVINHPYRFWYLIQKSKNYIGVIYITHENVIGIYTFKSNKKIYINCLREILNMHKPLKPIKSIRSEFFIINVNPKNQILIEAIKYLDLQHIQNTYVLKN